MKKVMCFIVMTSLFLLTGCSTYMFVSEADCIKNRGGTCLKVCSKTVTSRGGTKGCYKYVWIEEGAYLNMECSFSREGERCNAYGVGGIIAISALDRERWKKKRKEKIAKNIKEIQKTPKDAEAHYKLGRAYKRNSQYKLALQEYNQSIKLDPDFEPAYRYRSKLIYRYRSKLCCVKKDAALKDISKAIELVPHADSYRQRGDIFKKMRKYSLALDDYDKAIEINLLTEEFEYKEGNAYSHRGHLYIDHLNNMTKGCADLKKSCEIGSTFDRGRSYNPCGPYKREIKKGNCSDSNSTNKISKTAIQ